MLPYVFKYLGFKQIISPLFGLTQLIITPIIMGYIVFATAATLGGRYEGHALALFVYVFAYVVVRYAVSALYLIGRPHISTKDKFMAWLIGTPGAVYLNAILLIPTRYIALFKLFDNRWQTREAPSSQEVAPAFLSADSFVGESRLS
jgi:hyaluronan synthase